MKTARTVPKVVFAILAILLASVAVAVTTWVPIERKVYTGLEFLDIGEILTVGDLSGGGAFWYPIPEVVLRHREKLWVVDVLNRQYKNTTVASTGRSAGIWVCASGGSVEDYGYWFIEQPDYYTNILRFLDREFNELANYTYDFPAVEPAGIGDNVIFLSTTVGGTATDYFMVVKITCTPQFSIDVRRISLTLPSGYEFRGKPLAMGYSPTLVFAIVTNTSTGDYAIAYTVVSDIMTATTVELGHFTDFDYTFGIPLYGYTNGSTAVVGYAKGFEVKKYIIDLNTLDYQTVSLTTNLPLPDSTADVGFAGVITEAWFAYHTMFDATGVYFIDTQVNMRLPWYGVDPTRYSLGATYQYNAIPATKTEVVGGSIVYKAGVLLLHTEPLAVTKTTTETTTVTETIAGTTTTTVTQTTTEVVPIPVVETVTETTTVTTTVRGIALEPITTLLVLLVFGVILAILVATRRY